jgi:hypothetical protein
MTGSEQETTSSIEAPLSSLLALLQALFSSPAVIRFLPSAVHADRSHVLFLSFAGQARLFPSMDTVVLQQHYTVMHRLLMFNTDCP